jgi:hypothetical protein
MVAVEELRCFVPKQRKRVKAEDALSAYDFTLGTLAVSWCAEAFSSLPATPTRRCAFCASLRFALTGNPKNKAKRNFNFKMGLRTVSLPGANKI